MVDNPLWTRDGKGSLQTAGQENKADQPLWTRDGKGSLQSTPKSEPHRPEFDAAQRAEEPPVKKDEVKKEEPANAPTAGLSPTKIPKAKAQPEKKSDEPSAGSDNQEIKRYKPLLPTEALRQIEEIKRSR